jgi:biopolymer transport protein ExbD
MPRSLIVPLLLAGLLGAACEPERPPPATAGRADGTPEHAVLVMLAKNGAILFEGQDIPEATVEERIRRAVGSEPETRVVVAAEKGVPYARVTQTLEAARKAGAKRLALAQPQEAEGVTRPPPWRAPPIAVKPPPPPPPPVTLVSTPPPPPKPPGTPAEVGPDKWECLFPPDIDRSRIEATTVTLKVLVDASGNFVELQLLDNAPPAFVDAAKTCALRRRGWVPAKDPTGKPIQGWTEPVRVQFAR